jgi:hypothetical protein
MTVLPKKLQIAGLVVLVVVSSYIAGEYIAATRVAAARATLESTIEQQRVTLETLSEITARNGGDEVTDLIIKDCSVEERKAFDALLGRLDSGLAHVELETLDRLFGRCGYFFAHRKSIMVARLEREVALYKTFVSQLETITGSSMQDEYMVNNWTMLVDNENKQRELFMNLVLLQDQIIATLLQGKFTTSNEIQTILNEVKETQATLATTNTQTADLRAILVTKE